MACGEPDLGCAFERQLQVDSAASTSTTTGRSAATTDEIACWFVPTNGEHLVRHTYSAPASYKKTSAPSKRRSTSLVSSLARAPPSGALDRQDRVKVINHG